MENKKKGKFKGVKMGSFFLSHLEKLMKLEEGIDSERMQEGWRVHFKGVFGVSITCKGRVY